MPTLIVMRQAKSSWSTTTALALGHMPTVEHVAFTLAVADSSPAWARRRE